MASGTGKQAVNLQVDSQLLSKAREMELDIASMLEKAIEWEISRLQTATWLDENASALDCSREWANRNGLPLSDMAILKPKTDN